MTTQTPAPRFIVETTLEATDGTPINVQVDLTPVLYTHEQLTAAFREVQNRDHWKGPVDAVVPTLLVDLYDQAVGFFTATSCEVEDLENGYSRIRAAGYWAGPAA